LAGLNSNLSAGIAYTFTELALQAKLAIEWGFTGLGLMLTGTWQNESSELAASVGLSAEGVLMKLECDCPVSDILPQFTYKLWRAVSRICSSDSQCQ